MSPPLLFYRFNHRIHRLGLHRTAKVLSWLNRWLFGVWLPASATLGRGVTLGYWGLGVVVHSNSVLGDGCLIGQNVTIGRNFGDVAVPRIGNNVYLGAGSVVFGDITLGDNVVVGANSVVNKSIAANSIVAGNPVRIIGTTGGRHYRQLDADKLKQRQPHA